MANSKPTPKTAGPNTEAGDVRDPGRRDFMVVATYAMGAIGAAAVGWPLIDQMNPAADTLALASTEVDVSKIVEGQAITVTWRGKPVFIRHRTSNEIALANGVDDAELRDPQQDEARVQRPELLVIVGVCTHLGCVPLGQKTGDVKGDYDGWFCPCHGSHYDTSGRIRKGPAPTNLEVPPYSFLSEGVIRIG
ncbi:ubiquinol-cytochrome c reductase iron-sulfur subunit [SAR116 cluster bacterium]|nr:ubiquinol-cytochrome c reductase iron-sulfur subunit [SAR116 cluster bacterium]